MSAFPMRGPIEEPDRDPSIVALEEAGAVFEALASATAREIVSALSEDPLSPADLADRTGTSVQNVHYHLDRLADGDVVEVVDTWYSSRGVEMDVYALAARPVVVCVGGPADDAAGSGDTTDETADASDPDAGRALAPSD